ncbi:MAG TPA: ThuA domain-containing protein [Anaerolineales bacterium]
MSLFKGDGWTVEATYDLDALTRLDALGCQVMLSYTCLSKNGPEQEQATPERLTDEQVRGLRNWVQNGGALLAAHCATVIGESHAELARLLGGRFMSHPPPFTFTVYPVFGEHPITDDIQAFDVHDEFYIERCEPSVEIHMVAVNQGVAHPMAWSKQEGAGRVVHIAPGHFPEVWNHPLYQRLMLHAVNWLIEER